MKNLTDMIKESKTHPTISKSGYFLMVFDAPVTPVKNKGKFTYAVMNLNFLIIMTNLLVIIILLNLMYMA